MELIAGRIVPAALHRIPMVSPTNWHLGSPGTSDTNWDIQRMLSPITSKVSKPKPRAQTVIFESFLDLLDI